MPGVFVFCLGTMTVCVTALVAEQWRAAAIGRFEPDRLFTSSFFQSMREVPEALQFFLHAGAIKDCRPFGWSYGRMEFFELSEGLAVNVLPSSWLAECGIVKQVW